MGEEHSTLRREPTALDLLLNLAQLERQLRRHASSGNLAFDHGWDPRDCSPNMTVKDDHLAVVRNDSTEGGGTRELLTAMLGHSDMVRGKRGYSSGVHMWEIHWPVEHRGTHAVIGVATTDAPLTCIGKQSLLGSNDQSLGWDITHNKALYNECIMKSYPEGVPANFKAPEVILVILDMNEGTLKFKDPKEKNNYGLCLSGLTLFRRSGQKLYPAISSTKAGAVIKINYVGDSESRPEAVVRSRRPAIVKGPVPSGGYKFHSKCGANVTLSENRKTAIRTKALNKGVVLTSEPLKRDTLFEVIIDKKQGPTPKLPNSNSLEIGITSNNPATLRLPDTMTDLKFGHSWMVSGSSLDYNGRKAKAFSNMDANRLEEGQLLGLVVTSTGQIHIYVDGQLKEKCTGLNIPGTVYGVLDLFGRGEQATIVDRPTSDSKTTDRGATAAAEKKEPMTKTEELIEGLTLTIQKLKEKNQHKINEVRQLIEKHIKQTYDALEGQTQKQMFVDKFSDLGGAEAVAQYMVFLIDLGREQEAVSLCFSALQLTLVNFIYDSVKFASSLMPTSFYATMIKDVKRVLPHYKDSQVSAKRLLYWLTIMLNCTKAVETRDTLRKVESVPILKGLLASKSHEDSIVVVALSTLVNLSTDQEINSLNIPENVLKLLCILIKAAVQKPAGKLKCTIEFKVADKSFLFAAYELAQCLQEVAKNSNARRFLVDQGVADALFVMIEKGSKNEKEIALGSLWQMSTPETVAKIMRVPNLMGKLRKLKESDDEEVKQAATRLQVKLHELSNPPTKTEGQAMSLGPSHCEYEQACLKYIESLEIADEFKNPEFTTCFCASCHAYKGDQLYYNRGDPPQDYGLPIGWFRMGLKTHPRVNAIGAFNKWHRAYHGTKPNVISKILEVGDLLIPGDVALGGAKVGEREGHFTDKCKPRGFDTKQVFVSPSIRYAGHNAYATPTRYEDKRSKKVYTSRIALQVLIKPQSYKIGKETVGATSQIDPKFSNQELEWSTKERGSVIVYGLLVKLEEADRGLRDLFRI